MYSDSLEHKLLALWDTIEQIGIDEEQDECEFIKSHKLPLTACYATEHYRLCAQDYSYYQGIVEIVYEYIRPRYKNPSDIVRLIKLNSLLFTSDCAVGRSGAEFTSSMSRFVERVYECDWWEILSPCAISLLHICTALPDATRYQVDTAIAHENLAMLGYATRALESLQEQHAEIFIDDFYFGGSPEGLLWSNLGKRIARLFR